MHAIQLTILPLKSDATSGDEGCSEANSANLPILNNVYNNPSDNVKKNFFRIHSYSDANDFLESTNERTSFPITAKKILPVDG